jgi:flagellar basal-body rod protein FlgC
MSVKNVFDIAASAATAQAYRLNAVASNLANADSVAGADGKPYAAKQVVFQAIAAQAGSPAQGVKVADVVESEAPGRRQFDPKNPLADEEGYVTFSNVNVVEEMVNMISASRAYTNAIEVMNTAKQLQMKLLTLGT